MVDSTGLVERVERRPVNHPARVIFLAYLVGIAAGTILLMLPMAHAGGLAGAGGADFITALFTATSAVCVTGLTVVDTASYWSPFGHVVLLFLFQLGAIGIMAGATVVGLLVTRTLPLRGRLIASAELRNLDVGDVRQVMASVVGITLATEAVLTLWLALRFWSWGMLPGEALWHGLFLACSAFTNTGFATLTEGLAPHRNDVLLMSPLMLGVIAGSLGFPVLYELGQQWRRPARWSIHTKLTLWGSVFLLLAGLLVILALEWNNGDTLGPQGVGGKILSALFHSTMTRSGGFAVDDMPLMHRDSIVFSSVLMFIGGGSGSTAGGIRVTTFLVVCIIAWSEFRGNPDLVAFRRRIPQATERQSVTFVLMGFAVVIIGLLLLIGLTRAPVEDVLFEVISAYATCGLSTGVSAAAPASGKFVLVVLMYIGRAGPLALAMAHALKVRASPYRYPEESPIVG